MNREEGLVLKAALALADPFLVELVRRAMVADPKSFVGKVKRASEILELENPVAASVRHAAILARDFPAKFQELTRKNEVKMKTITTGLFLQREQIHVGMTVAIALEGKSLPEVDADGNLLLLQILDAGNFGVKLYPLRSASPQRDAGGEPKLMDSIGSTESRPDVRFMPIYVFSAKVAPRLTEFVVFVNGERLTYPKSSNIVYVFKDQDGRILSVHHYEYDWWLKEFPLPGNVRLVPISEFGQAGPYNV